MGRLVFRATESRFNFWKSWYQLCTFTIIYIFNPIAKLLRWFLRGLISFFNIIWSIFHFIWTIINKSLQYIWYCITLKYVINTIIISMLFFLVYGINAEYLDWATNLNFDSNEYIYNDIGVILLKQNLGVIVEDIWYIFYKCTPYHYENRRVIFIGDYWFLTNLEFIRLYLNYVKQPLQFMGIVTLNNYILNELLWFLLVIILLILFFLFLYNLLEDYLTSKWLRYNFIALVFLFFFLFLSFVYWDFLQVWTYEITQNKPQNTHMQWNRPLRDRIVYHLMPKPFDKSWPIFFKDFHNISSLLKYFTIPSQKKDSLMFYY